MMQYKFYGCGLEKFLELLFILYLLGMAER